MASRAIRFVAVLPVKMAVSTVHRRMRFIQLESDYGVFEIVPIPSTVAIDTIAADLRYFLSGGMTGVAIEFIMIAIQRPSGVIMRKSRSLSGIMAFLTIFGAVAIIANGVHLLHGLGQGGRFLKIMAITAIFLLVTIDAPQSEKDNMLLMPESNYRPALQRRMIGSLFRHGDIRVGNPDDIGGINRLIRHQLTIGWEMTEDALGIMAPFAMTGKAMTVIGAFQAGLAKVVRIGFSAVAIFAWLYFIFWAIMVTGGALSSHLSHSGMQFMIEMHRLVEVGKFI